MTVWGQRPVLISSGPMTPRRGPGAQKRNKEGLQFSHSEYELGFWHQAEFDHCFHDVSPYTLICGKGKITLLSGSWFNKIVYVNYLGSGTEQELSKWKLLAFLRVLLKSNWWRLSFTYLKCTFWWVLIYIYGCTTIAMIKIKISTPSHVCSSSLGIQPSLLSKKKKIPFPSKQSYSFCQCGLMYTF